jgi:hypothetical protein
MRLVRSLFVLGFIGTAVAPIAARASVPTKLEASAWVSDVWVMRSDKGSLGFDGGSAQPYARLTDRDGAPIAGRRIDFTRQASPLCSATTDQNGNATCEADTTNGYTAKFAGDDVYGASTDDGAGIRITGDYVEADVLGDGQTFAFTVH